MFIKSITYTDYNGIERTENFRFNLSKAELVEFEMGVTGGLSEMITKITNTQDIPKIIDMFKKLILKAYGEKSDDGKRFIKSEELSTAFSQTEAYSVLFMELATDVNKAAEFFNNLIPNDATAVISNSENHTH